MSKISFIEDKRGVRMHYGDAGRVWFPPFPLPHSYMQQLDVIKNTVIWDDDVIITGHAKSGSHWHYEMISMLERGTADYVKTDKATQMLEQHTADVTANLPSPRILNTHVPFDLLPAQVFEKKTKIVFLLRNPKDVAVSLHCHMIDWTAGGYEGAWPDFLQFFLTTGVWCNNWFTFVREWEKQMESHPEQPVFMAVFEEVVRDPVGHVMKLNEFLGTGRSPELCADIAAACCFSKLKVANEQFKENHLQGVWKEGSPGFFRKDVRDILPVEIPTLDFCNSIPVGIQKSDVCWSKVGDWENWFTKEQNEEFDAVYKKEMHGSKLNIIFKL